MGVELRPFGVKCNIACQYCYQHPQRDVEQGAKPYNIERMKAAVLREGSGFSLFGGEALLVPLEDLEELWAWGLEKFGKNALQTNGTLITDRHIELFRKYKVDVGISIDGPGELNDVRWAGSLKRTRRSTNRTEQAIRRLCEEGLPPALIITLHRGNAGTPEKMKRMGEWMRELDRMGVRAARLHLMEVEFEEIRQAYHLSPEENMQALCFFYDMKDSLQHMRFDLFSEIEQLLLGKDENTSCVWNACDPYTTAAVRGVEGNGQRSNCGRTNKEGIDFLKAGLPAYMRYVALYNTPQEAGGCQGCRFFSMCKGQCPGTSLQGDWRNRTEHCEVWKALFEKSEERMIEAGLPVLSRHPLRMFVEQKLVEGWSNGVNSSIGSLMRQIQEQQQRRQRASCSEAVPTD
ncbi:MAG: radical SAM protein [Cytophagales bacterium]|nr:radical SAM protein [Cytophagales bacterium]